MASRQDSNSLERLKEALHGLPLVLICGRPNVGKSSLFNRIVGAQRSIVSPIPGATRDLNLARVSVADREFVIVDSGGLDPLSDDSLGNKLAERTLSAARLANAIIFVVDGREGLNPLDLHGWEQLRLLGRPLFVAVNKLDRPGMNLLASEFHALGVERLFAISAAHGHGVGELLENVAASLPPASDTQVAASDLRFALIGRPNVGKSSLLNRLVGFERSTVDATAGTTRDPVDVELEFAGRRLLLIDTGGVRRRSRVEGELENRTVARALATMRRAEVLGLVIDATEGITDQDARLARLVDKHERALVLIVNKWDLASARGQVASAFKRDIEERYPFLDYAPAVFCSALTGDGVGQILERALEVGEDFRASFKTSHLNRILASLVAEFEPPTVSGKKLKLMYVTQTASAPPRLVFFTNIERDIPTHYLRFLESRFRQALGLVGTPLKIELRKAPSGRRATKANDVEHAETVG